MILQNHTADNKWDDLVDFGRNTRFGSSSGPCPSQTAKKYNYRKVQSIARRIGAAPVPACIGQRDIIPEDMLRNTYPPCVEITALHYIVAKMFAMALNGNVRMQSRLEIIIDGPI